MEDKDSSILIFKKNKPNGRRKTWDKGVIRRDSAGYKDKLLPQVLPNDKPKFVEPCRLHIAGKQNVQLEITKIKEKNNELSAQNIRLRTINATLERENTRIQKTLGEKSPFLPAESSLLCLKQLLRENRKRIQELESQNNKQKKSVKHTRVLELEYENKHLREETHRLMSLISPAEPKADDSHSSKRALLQESVLRRFNLTASRKTRPSLDKLKGEAKVKGKENISSPLEIKRRRQQLVQNIEGVQFKCTETPTIELTKCKECDQNRQAVDKYMRQVMQLEGKLNLKQETANSQQAAGESPRPQLLGEVKEFLTFRFKAHHLSIDELGVYISQEEPEKMTVDFLTQLCLIEPFCLTNKQYLNAFIGHIFGSNTEASGLAVEGVISKLKCFLGDYQLIGVSREEEMYMQVAELITAYRHHIEGALMSRKNADGTITKSALEVFLSEIELDNDYIDFIVTQLILESRDLDHLNYHNLFQVFCIPQLEQESLLGSRSCSPNSLTRFPNIGPVKQLDEQYQESQASNHIEPEDNYKEFKEHQVLETYPDKWAESQSPYSNDQLAQEPY